MRKVRFLPLLLAALLLFACAKPEQGRSSAIGPDDVALTVGEQPVYAVVYRYTLSERLRTIEEHALYEQETYLSYVSNPNISYVYAYYDTRTDEGKKALAEDVLNELALEAAALDAGTKADYRLTAQEQSYLYQAQDDAAAALDGLLKANGGTYDSLDAFYVETGFTKERFEEMFTRSMQASILFNRLLEDFSATYTLADEALESGYAQIVKETFADRYTAGMYAQYLAFYLAGSRMFPSLYIPDGAIFVRPFVKTDPTEEERAAFDAQAQTDFNALYASSDNEFTVQGTVGDLAVAPGDSLIDGLYEAAKDVAIGSIGMLEREQDGKNVVCWFLRVDGETGVVPIDRYPGVRERIVSQLTGKACMDTLREAVKDPSLTVRNEAVIDAIYYSEIGA